MSRKQSAAELLRETLNSLWASKRAQLPSELRDLHRLNVLLGALENTWTAIDYPETHPKPWRASGRDVFDANGSLITTCADEDDAYRRCETQNAAAAALSLSLARRDAERLVPGKAPWDDFLDARARLILEWRAEGQSFEWMAKTLSCDPVQAQLIHATFTEKK